MDYRDKMEEMAEAGWGTAWKAARFVVLGTVLAVALLLAIVGLDAGLAMMAQPNSVQVLLGFGIVVAIALVGAAACGELVMMMWRVLVPKATKGKEESK